MRRKVQRGEAEKCCRLTQRGLWDCGLSVLDLGSLSPFVYLEWLYWEKLVTMGLEVKVHFLRRRWLSNNDLKLPHSVLGQIFCGPALVRTLQMNLGVD